MDTGLVVVLLVGVVEIGVGLLVSVLAGLLLWSYRRLQPQEVLESEVVRLANEFETLKGKYLRLRGQKARETAQQNQTKKAPFLAGLSPEDAALFEFPQIGEEVEAD